MSDVVVFGRLKWRRVCSAVIKGWTVVARLRLDSAYLRFKARFIQTLNGYGRRLPWVWAVCSWRRSEIWTAGLFQVWKLCWERWRVRGCFLRTWFWIKADRQGVQVMPSIMFVTDLIR